MYGIANLILVLLIIGGIIVAIIFTSRKSTPAAQTAAPGSNAQMQQNPAVNMFQNGNTAFNNKNYTDAIGWFHQAASRGHILSQNFLGYMYCSGMGTAQDYAEAARWYRMAAEQGLAGAQHNLGWMYENGLGVTKDTNQAIEWYRKAAVQGDENAKKAFNRLVGN